MKLNKAEICIFSLTAAFAVFVGGFVLGRNSRDYVVAQPAVQVQAPEVPNDSGRINLNTATEEELITLPGIGAARAKAIVEYRQKIGGFVNVHQLEGVSGIGPKIMEDLLPYVTVS